MLISKTTLTIIYHRFVKMSSPNLNNIIVLGDIFVFLSVLAGGIDGRIVDGNIQTTACQVCHLLKYMYF